MKFEILHNERMIRSCSTARVLECLSPSSAMLDMFDCCVFISLECIYKNDTGAQLIRHFDSSSRAVSRNIVLAIPALVRPVDVL